MKKYFLLLCVMLMAFASDKYDFVENDTKPSRESKYIGAIYKQTKSKWEAHRWSTNEKKLVYRGYYNNEETAARASDNLARNLMKNGEKGHMLNFPDDDTEVSVDEETVSSIYFGVHRLKRNNPWTARRWSKKKRKMMYNGTNYKDEEAAAYASDTLARKLMECGEHHHKLNFPENYIEVNAKQKFSKYIGVYYQQKRKTWQTQRYSRNEKKNVCYGYYKNEEIAAHASDTLARKLIANGERGHMFNFPNDDTEVHREKKNRFYRGQLQRKPVNMEGVETE
jgi:hypothetical protein